MEEGGPSFGKKYFQKLAVTWLLFLKSEKRHIGVIPHHHTLMWTKGDGQGRRVRSMEVGGGDLVGGELAPFVFYFPQPLAFFGFSPHNFLIRAKMHKLKKETKGGRHDPIFTHPEWGHKAGEPNGGGWGGDFSFGWMDIGAKKKIWKFHLEIQILISFSSTQSRNIGDGQDYARLPAKWRGGDPHSAKAISWMKEEKFQSSSPSSIWEDTLISGKATLNPLVRITIVLTVPG